MTARIIKTETDGTPKAGVIFPTVEVFVSKDAYEFIMENQPEKVTNYLARKVAASSNQMVKVGRTLTYEGRDGRLYGSFNWSLSGVQYPQRMMWDNDHMRWNLSAPPTDYTQLQQVKDEKAAKEAKAQNS